MITPTWSATFEALHSATTARGLWTVLLSWHGIRSSAAWEEPFGLFMRFHRHDSADAVVTAALLCSDHRWRTGSHHLVHRIGDAGVLTARDVETLAEQFLTETFDIEVVNPPGIAAGRGRVADDPPVSIISRPVWPPLRRWAAWQVVQRHPVRWRELFAYADELPSRDGAAVAAGVLDAASYLPVADVRDAVTVGLAAGSGTVRLAALPVLAALDGVDAALACARADASAKVRVWSPRSGRTQSAPSLEPTETCEQQGRDQQRLF